MVTITSQSPQERRRPNMRNKIKPSAVRGWPYGTMVQYGADASQHSLIVHSPVFKRAGPAASLQRYCVYARRWRSAVGRPGLIFIYFRAFLFIRPVRPGPRSWTFFRIDQARGR